MASLFTNEQLPKTSEEALREFNERYLASLTVGPVASWADKFKMGVGAPRTTFPISLIATKYLETKERSNRTKTLEEESFDVKVVEFDAGYEAEALQLFTNTFAYRNWQKAPGRFVTAEGKHVCKNLATLLEA